MNVQLLMECSLREMVIPPVKQADLGVARSTTEAVGMKPGMDTPILLVWLVIFSECSDSFVSFAMGLDENYQCCC